MYDKLLQWALIFRRYGGTGLGFRQQRKVWADKLGGALVLREGLGELQKLGGTPALAGLGIVDPTLLDSEIHQLLAGPALGSTKASFVYRVLNLEAWLQMRL